MESLPYRRLDAWQQAFALAMTVFDLAERPEIARQFYFRDQLCSAAMSVAANVAEGHGRGTALDFASFIDRARGSLFEVDTWLLAALTRGWITQADFDDCEKQALRVNAIIFALRTSLRAEGKARRQS